MPINELIAQGSAPIQIETPVNQLARVLQMQRMQQANQMDGLKMDEYQRGKERSNGLIDLNRRLGNATDEERSLAYKKEGYLPEADVLDKGVLERRRINSDASAKDIKTAREKLEIAGSAFNHVRQNPTLENAHAVLDYLGSNRVYTPELVAQYKAQASANPADIGRLADIAFRSALDAKDQLAKHASENLGGNMVYNSTDPLTGKVTQTGLVPITQSADNRATTGLGYAKLKEENRHNTQTETDGKTQVIVDPVRGPMLINKKTALVTPAFDGQGNPVQGEIPAKREANAKNLLPILDQADVLIKKSTGSYIGAGVDQVERVFGSATKGDKAIAQLKVLEGSLMMNQPRMEGPQSDKDVAVYKQMAGQIGDPTVPREIKQAAMKSIRQLTEKYANVGAAAPSATGSGATVSGW